MIKNIKLPIGTDAFKNVDDAAINHLSPSLINAYTDELGATNKRPGLTSWIDLGTGYPVEGLYWWEFDQSVIAVSNGRIWRITDAGGTKSEISSGGDLLDPYGTTLGRVRVEFAELDTYVFMANGKFVYYPDGASLSKYVNDADADAPTHVHYVTAHDKYILCDDASAVGKIMYSNVGVPLAWNALDFFTLESKPDDLMQVRSAWREIFLPGSDSIEVWFNDGVTPFSRLEGAYTEDGILASYSLVNSDGVWLYLNKNRDVVALSGRTPRVISGPFAKFLDSLTFVSDAWGQVVKVAGRSFYVLTFQQEDKTIVCDVTRVDSGGGWSEWGAWGGAAYADFIGRAYCYAVGFNFHLWGGTDGKIYKMDPDTYKDGATAIRTVRQTGRVDHGTGMKKRSLRLRVKIKKEPVNVDVASPQLKIRWRDDNDAAWGSYRTIDIASDTRDEFYIDLYQLGVYRARQWEFLQEQACGFCLIEAEESVEVMTR